MTKLTANEESFCQEVIKNDGNATAAYKASAYASDNHTDKSINECACRLMGTIKVHSRIQELRDALAKRNEVTVDSLSAQLNTAITMCHKLKQGSAMVSGVMGKAKLHGFLIDKKITSEIPIEELLGSIMGGEVKKDD